MNVYRQKHTWTSWQMLFYDGQEDGTDESSIKETSSSGTFWQPKWLIVITWAHSPKGQETTIISTQKQITRRVRKTKTWKRYLSLEVRESSSLWLAIFTSQTNISPSCHVCCSTHDFIFIQKLHHHHCVNNILKDDHCFEILDFWHRNPNDRNNKVLWNIILSLWQNNVL